MMVKALATTTTSFAEVEDDGVRVSAWMSHTVCGGHDDGLDLASFRHVASYSDFSDLAIQFVFNSVSFSIFDSEWAGTPWTSGEALLLSGVYRRVAHWHLFMVTCCSNLGATPRQQLSDPYDSDQDGSPHNGHPAHRASTRCSWCGPFSRAAGEEQTCACPASIPRHKLLGLAPAVARCESCPPGASSSSRVIACSNCLLGMFNDCEIPKGASYQASLAYFLNVLGLTWCQEGEV